MSYIDYDGPGELHITDIDTARTIDKSQFDRVITVCQDSITDNVPESIQYSHYNMSDGVQETEDRYGGSSEYELFERATQELSNALSNNETVLIHCHAGQSRSVSVSVAALGQIIEASRSSVLPIIKHYRPQAHPDLLLLQHADRYISEQTDINSGPSFTGIRKE